MTHRPTKCKQKIKKFFCFFSGRFWKRDGRPDVRVAAQTMATVQTEKRRTPA